MRFDSVGLFWEDAQATRGGPRTLGPMPEIPETGWRPPTDMPNIRHSKWHSIDVETWDPELNEAGPGWARGKGHIVGISVAVPDAKWYFPMRHEVQKELNLDPDMVTRWAKWALGDDSVKIGANITYDVGWLAEEGIKLGGKIYDVQFAEALLNETNKLALDELGWKYLRQGKTTDLLKPWAKSYYGTGEQTWRKDIYRCPVTLVGPYAEDDAAMPYQVLMKQWPQLVMQGLMPLFEMECGLIRLFVEMRQAGVQVDIPYAEQLEGKLAERQKEWQQRANHLAGFDVNTGSSRHLARAFDNLGLPYGRTAPTEKHPDGQPSFTGDFLATVKHPFAEAVNQVQDMEKLLGTFIRSYLLEKHVNGKIFCSFNQVSGSSRKKGGARTGRLSSSDPNLQNIPTRTEEGKMIRQAFIMDYGHLQVRDYDYSQIEYRMLAHFATGAGSDEVRLKYNEDPDLDYHDMIGDMIFAVTGIRLSRSHVKNINFGLVYGLGIETLAMYLKTSVDEAKQLSEAFHAAVTFAKSTMDDLSTEVNRTGIVKTILGRQSHFDMWEPVEWYRRKGGAPLPIGAAREKWGNNIMRAYLYRALNYRLQGSAADCMKMAMYQCYTQGVFAETGVPRLTVHDELFFSDPGGKETAWDEVKRICETCIPSKVPLRFDCGVGPNWREAH